jgi:hypothetical protein
MTRRASEPPIWLLDVDGVLNAVTNQPDPAVWPDWRQGTATADGVRWPICFSPTVARSIRRIHESGLAEVRWLTTWGGHANGELRELLGLPELPVVAERPSLAAALPDDAVVSGAASHGDAVGDHGPWWKLAAVQAVVEAEPDRVLVWTDDELRYQIEATWWVADHVRRSLLLSPPPRVGLPPRLLRQIEDFCAGEIQRPSTSTGGG